MKAETTWPPGAKISSAGPQLDDGQRDPSGFIAPTVMTLATLPGLQSEASSLEFPAATTTVMPLSTAACTAEFTAALRPVAVLG